MECAQEAAQYQAKLDEADQVAALEKIKAAGVAIHVPTDKAKWVEACKPMLAEYRAKGAAWNSFIDKMLAIQ
jgi:C4-dicarboxylate-binding protein DctP